MPPLRDLPRRTRSGIDDDVRLHLDRLLRAAQVLHRERNDDRLELARSADDVERIAAAGRVASMIGVEGGHAIGCSLGTLRVLAELGTGYLTLTHNDDTPWADSATGERLHGGLTGFGDEEE